MQQEANADNWINLLEQKFSAALNSGQRELADQLFNELCGHKMTHGSALPIQNIEGNPDVLIGLAAQIRDLKQEENEKLKLEAKTEGDKTRSFFWQHPIDAPVKDETNTEECSPRYES